MKIVNVMASSIDGRIGAAKIEGDLERQGQGISSQADQDHLRREIEQSGAILVGASSIRANGECLDHPGIGGTPPHWIVFANSEIPSSFHFWQQKHIPRTVISPKALPMHDVAVQNIVSSTPHLQALELLRQDSMDKVLLFGGGIVNSWFYEASLVDELVLTLAPRIVGNSDAPNLVEPVLSQGVNLTLQSSQVSENFVFLRYRVSR